jgi:CRISPR-associated endonuclease/helicase Cas3
VIDEIEESGDTALIVCNHVATSQAVWQRVNNDYGIPAMLLHSRFNGRDRRRIEEAITSDNKPRILVATQAVEVSLDLDYNRGYTEPAPVDALGQRFGRINRKGKRPTPAPIVIFEEPAGGYLYDQELTDRTVNLFRQIGALTEAGLVELVDAVYADGYTGAAAQDFQRGLGHPLINNFQQEIIPGTHRSWTDDILDSSDGQLEVLPDCLLEEFKELRKGQRYVEADQLLVPIRLGQKFKAEKMGALFYDKDLREFVTTLRYSSDSGLDLSGQSDNIL